MYSDTLNYFEVTYYVMYGFINNTIGVQSLNSSTCMDIMEDYYYNTTLELPTDIKSKDIYDISLATSYYFRNVDPLVKSCLWTVDETRD